MFQRIGLTVWVVLMLVGYPAMAQDQTSRVLKIQLPKLVLDRYDAEAILFYKDNAFQHGYVRVPDRDNLPHRVDVTPSSAIQFVDKDGKVIDIPDYMRSSYSYKNKKFHAWKGRYEKGDIKIVHPIPIKPLQIDGKKLVGDLGVLIMEEDEANSAGRNNHDLVYRMKIDATFDGDTFKGSAEVWSYKDSDDDYGKDSPRRSIAISGGWDADYWQPKPGSGYAPGKAWPMAHGPHLTGSAIAYDGELIHNLHDAKLMWVAEDIIPSGRSGGMSRGGFAMFTFPWKTIGYGGYGAPIIADDKVFVFLHTADLDAILADPETKKNPFLRLGIDPRALGQPMDKQRDTILCFDARTGKTLWRYFGKTGGVSRVSKGGVASTPCYAEGKVYVRGMNGLYCLEAETGKLVWRKGGDKGNEYGLHEASYEGSVVMLGKTLMMVLGGYGRTCVVGVDRNDGSLKWKHEKMGGNGIGLPGKFVHAGKAYAVMGRQVYQPDKRDQDKTLNPDNFVMLDPETGKIIWESEALRNTDAQMVVWQDIAIGNATPGVATKLKGKKVRREDVVRAGAAKLGMKGAERLWASKDIDLMSIRCMNVAHDGVFYVDTRRSGFVALDMRTGKVLGKHPHIYNMTQGSHNWVWHVASNDRIITSGVAMFSTADKGFKLLPGRLSLDITSGYRAPTKPAVSDGRIVLRLADKLVCYDLRQHEKNTKQVITLTAKNALPGAVPEAKDVRIRIRKDGDTLESIGAKIQRHTGPEQWKFSSWAGSWDGNLPWRKTIPHDLKLTDSEMSGPVKLRLGWQWEDWQFDIKRNGENFEGVYKRIAPALNKPIDSAGRIEGQKFAGPDGETYYMLYLHKGAASRQGLEKGEADQNMTVILSAKDGKILRGYGAAGRVNVVTHEVDPRGLKLAGDHITGELYLIYHDDRYQDLHVDSSLAQMRAAAQGPNLAALHKVDATPKEEKSMCGEHKTTIGVRWEQSGKISGKLEPDAAP